MADSHPPDSQTGQRPPLPLRIGRLVAFFDRFVVDGIINAGGFLVFAAAEGLRTLQTGKIQVALLAALAALVVTLIAVMLGLPNLFMGALPLEGAPC